MKPFELKIITFLKSFCGYFVSQEAEENDFYVNNDIIFSSLLGM